MQMPERPPHLTRVDIIGDRVHEFWADEWMVSVQDDGKTLKLFQRGDGEAAKADRDRALTEDVTFTLNADD